MGFHTFDAEHAERLEDAAGRYRYCSREELVRMLAPAGDETVADLGSGTGFYTDDIAPHVDSVRAVDVQPAMHDHYRRKGVPPNVDLVTADVVDLPFDTDGLDGMFSTMTFHEFASADALDELARVCRDDARLAVVDWSAAGDGEAGPPTTERYDAETSAEMVENAGFGVAYADDRVETFALVAER